MTKPYKIKYAGTFRDLIRYLDPDCIESAERGKGALIGMVGTMMAIKGMEFKRALATVIANSPRGARVEIRRVPESWRHDWREIADELGV